VIQINKHLFKQVCIKKLDLKVREHLHSSGNTSQIASAQEVRDPLEAATGSPPSVLFGAWILLRPAHRSVVRYHIDLHAQQK
jgi:hypothetical protein